MKAAHILNKIEYSGAEIMIYQASKVFGENGIETTLVASEKEPGRFEQSMRNVGYSIVSVGSDSKTGFLKNFYTYFKNNRFDVVHIHTEKHYLWKVALLRLTGHRNIVRTFHNCWSFGKLITARNTIHRRLATMLGVKKHAIGDAVLKNERKEFHNRCFLINNWISMNTSLITNREAIRTTKRAELGIDQDSFVIISVGGCSPIKNHGFIIDLVEELDAEAYKITYLHVGTGVDEEAEKTKVREMGLSSRVIFTGNRNDVPELLVCADVYLMPSLFEGLSIALLEAMYYNGLVVVNDARGLNNMVDNNLTGFVVSIENSRNYIELLKKMINNEVDTAAIKNASRRFIEENFAMEKNAGELVKYYKLNTKFN